MTEERHDEPTVDRGTSDSVNHQGDVERGFEPASVLDPVLEPDGVSVAEGEPVPEAIVEPESVAVPEPVAEPATAPQLDAVTEPERDAETVAVPVAGDPPVAIGRHKEVELPLAVVPVLSAGPEPELVPDSDLQLTDVVAPSHPEVPEPEVLEEEPSIDWGMVLGRTDGVATEVVSLSGPLLPPPPPVELPAPVELQATTVMPSLPPPPPHVPVAQPSAPPVRASVMPASSAPAAAPPPPPVLPAPPSLPPAPSSLPPAPTTTAPLPPVVEPERKRLLDEFDPQPRSRRRRRRRRPLVVGLAIGVPLLLAGLYVGAQWLWSDRVPPGTTVAGVEIGGMKSNEAIAALQTSLTSVTDDQLPIAVGENQTSLDPAASGLVFDASATVKALTGFSLQPMRLWNQVFGSGTAEPVSTVDRAALTAALSSLTETVATPPIDGTIVFLDGQPTATAPVDGVGLDVEAAADVLATSWMTAARPVELPTVVALPAIDQTDIDTTMKTIAQPLAAAPIGVAVADQVADLPVDIVTGAAAFLPVDGELQLQVDGTVLVQAVVDRTTNLLTVADDAEFSFETGTPTIVGGQPGTTIDPAALSGAVIAAATSTDRTARVDLVQSDPTDSVAALQALGIAQIVSEYSTPLANGETRTINIANGASKINGTLIRPGEEFSIGEVLGPIDSAHGYVEAGAIIDGQHIDAMGGGLCQTATTSYNAAYDAGMEIVERTPHSQWFSRYPEGRDAAVFMPNTNMRWKNNTPYGALMQSWVADGRMYVRIWSTPYWTVESTTSGRSSIRSPGTVYSQSADCAAQSAGNPGFTVTATRRVLLQGVESDVETWTTTYEPQNRIVCGPAPGG